MIRRPGGSQPSGAYRARRALAGFGDRARIVTVLAVSGTAAVLITALLATSALGYRNATPRQRAAVIAAAIRQHKIPAKRAACYWVAISEVSARWALVGITDSEPKRCGEDLFFQPFIEHRTAAGWVLPKIRYRRMETTSTTTGTGLSRCPVGGVPVAVLREFGQIQPGCPGNR